jgi:hypothetical protein
MIIGGSNMLINGNQKVRTAFESENSRMKLLMTLHDIVLNMNDENAYDEWIRDDIPDCPSEKDFEEIALDDDFFDEVLEDFIRIFKIYKYAE